MKLGLLIFVHNDLKMLTRTLLYNKPQVDQLCIFDLGSDDGTEEFCSYFLSPGDSYRRYAYNAVPEKGFDWARNQAIAMCNTDWHISMGANSILPPSDWHMLRYSLSQANLTDNCFALPCYHIPPINPPHEGDLDLNFLESTILNGNQRSTENHRRVFRRSAGITYKGFIHEEPFYPDGKPVADFKVLDSIRLYHFADWTNRKIRRLRYSWILLKNSLNPHLQDGTNSWWYETYVPQNIERIRQEAAEYVQYCGEHHIR